MPALGMAQETGRLVRWLKREGEQVAKGEVLMEVETDKATVEVEAPAGGTVAAITAVEGDEVPVGQTIALILAPGESVASVQRSVTTAHEPQPLPQSDPASTVLSPSTPHAADRPPASPKARRLAEERGVDIARIAGSGPGGAVLEGDVLQAHSDEAQAESRTWRAMVENVSRGWREAPHFFVIREIDATALVEERARQPEGVTYTDLLVRATAQALVKHPRMNGSKAEVNIGLAVSRPAGLIVPVIHGADRLEVAEIANQRRLLLDRVRASKPRSADLSGGTFTLSNLGMYGVDLFTAILTEGQAGILAVGRIADRVVARNGVPAVRPTVLISLSCDHRSVDGAHAAHFVDTLASLLETKFSTEKSRPFIKQRQR
jgi:pyruvate dehydrogenase E2 component (dihydrolipoamide acetyltransferase)